jgi:hypothetical protein
MDLRKWVTGERCISCGHSRVFFYEERTEDGGPDGPEHLGDLICAACGSSQFQETLIDLGVSEHKPDLGPLFGGVK